MEGKMSKTIIITGASRGIGRRTAMILAEDGYNIIANYNKSEKEANMLKYDLEQEGCNIDIFKADVSLRSECQKLIEFAINKYKKIDVLINNAGISHFGLFTELTDEEINRMIKVNLFSAIYLSQEAAKQMIHQKEGCIINMSSIWGLTGASCEVIYSITKAGIDGLTKSLAKELGPSNIRVNSIAPGIIETDMIEKLSSEEIEEIEKQIPLGKMGGPQDIAKTIEWLIEDGYTTGQIISPNGGWVI